VGTAGVASNKVTRTFGNGSLELVPPVRTTPRTDLGFADETACAVINMATPATTTRVMISLQFFMKILSIFFLELTIDSDRTSEG
jgi:hypothetical protein